MCMWRNKSPIAETYEWELLQTHALIYTEIELPIELDTQKTSQLFYQLV